MLAKLVLFALLCLAVLAFYKGAKKIIRLISKGDGCNCSKKVSLFVIAMIMTRVKEAFNSTG